MDFANLEDYVSQHRYAVNRTSLNDEGWSLADTRVQELIEKLHNVGVPLGEYCGREPFRGVLTGLNRVFIVPRGEISTITKGNKQEQNIFLPYLRGRNVQRYRHESTGEYLLFTDGITPESHPNVMSYLEVHKPALAARTDIRNTSKKWYELRPCSYYDLLTKPKIMYASVAQRGNFTLDSVGTFIDKTCYFIPSDDRYLLGILNSSTLFFYFSQIAVQRRGDYYEYLAQYVAQLPIRLINFDDLSDKAKHDQMVALVEKMLRLKPEHAAAESAFSDKRHELAEQIARTDKQIDALVYELYGLTDEEIQIVEGG